LLRVDLDLLVIIGERVRVVLLVIICEAALAVGIEDLATVYLAAVRAAQPTGPYHLAGWSMGGSVAYEMARLLRQGGERVAFLGLVDTRPRESFNLSRGEHEDRSRLLSAFLWITALAVGQSTPPRLASLAASRGDIAEIATALNDAGVLPASIDPDRAERYFRLWQAHIRALHDYWPGALDCPVTLFRASEPPPKEVAELLRLDGDRDRMVDGWRGRCTAGLRTIDVPGNHYTVVSQQHAEALAHAFRSALEEESDVG
jgi:thioesterase domain-containing protein